LKRRTVAEDSGVEVGCLVGIGVIVGGIGVIVGGTGVLVTGTEVAVGKSVGLDSDDDGFSLIVLSGKIELPQQHRVETISESKIIPTTNPLLNDTFILLLFQ
jgi:hypothetical protein